MSDNMNEPFFTPWCGENYEDGLECRWVTNDKKENTRYKTMVLGLNHICNYSGCPHHKDCKTNEGLKKVEEEYKDKLPCICYDSENWDEDSIKWHRLSNSNYVEIGAFIESFSLPQSLYPTYKNITRLMCGRGFADPLSEEDSKSFWDYVVFQNFFQHFSDRNTAIPCYDDCPDVYKKDIPALKSILEKYTPDIVYVWTDDLTKALEKEKGLKLERITDANLPTGISLFSYGKKVRGKVTKKDIREILETNEIFRDKPSMYNKESHKLRSEKNKAIESYSLVDILHEAYKKGIINVDFAKNKLSITKKRIPFKATFVRMLYEYYGDYTELDYEKLANLFVEKLTRKSRFFKKEELAKKEEKDYFGKIQELFKEI